MSSTTPAPPNPHGNAVVPHDATDVIIVVRHGERLDYVMRDKGQNWIASAAAAASSAPTSASSSTTTTSRQRRPWDPPLSTHGKEQGAIFGRHLSEVLMKQYQLPPLAAIYTSPLLRCRQTAVAALDAYNNNSNNSSNNSSSKEDNSSNEQLKVKVEVGLIESLNENWYRSWALIPESDGTWGCRPAGKEVIAEIKDMSQIHPIAQIPIQSTTILDGWRTQQQQQQQCDDDDDDDDDTTSTTMMRQLLDTGYNSVMQIDKPFCCHPPHPTFESRKEQRERMMATVEALCGANAGSDGDNETQAATTGAPTATTPKTIVLVSHGGPVTHLYEELTGQPWQVHGASSYCCYSVYYRRQQQQGEDDDDGNAKGKNAVNCDNSAKESNNNNNITKKHNKKGDWIPILVNESDYLHEKNKITESHISADEK